MSKPVWLMFEYYERGGGRPLLQQDSFGINSINHLIQENGIMTTLNKKAIKYKVA